MDFLNCKEVHDFIMQGNGSYSQKTRLSSKFSRLVILLLLASLVLLQKFASAFASFDLKWTRFGFQKFGTVGVLGRAGGAEGADAKSFDGHLIT